MSPASSREDAGRKGAASGDAFDVLGVEPRFDLNLAAVEKRHLELSKALHPDRYVGAPSAERRLALSRAIDVNAAWRAVRDPARRAELLLARAGVDAGELAQPKPPAGLLMEMLEAREELSEAAAAKDLAKVASFAEAMLARRAEVESRLSVALAVDPRGALSILGELRYVVRFLDEVGAIEERLG